MTQSPDKSLDDRQLFALDGNVSDRISSRDINRLLDEFEATWQSSLEYLERFVHDAGVRDRTAILTELVRVDLDRRYAASLPVEIDRYLKLFPNLSGDAEAIGAIAYEDFRSRVSRGLPVHRDRWQHLPSIAKQSWFQKMEGSCNSNSAAESPVCQSWPQHQCNQLPRRLTPKVGQAFGEFFLLKLLGRGAFSEVFLARQETLASRYVAVKVVKRTLSEPASLARLQHTGIVPLYSLHRIGDYSILCMPYAGSATLADWLSKRVQEKSRRHGQTFVETLETSAKSITVADLEAGLTEESLNRRGQQELNQLIESFASPNVDHLRGLDNRDFYLLLAHRLASAVSHAHQRGIVHGDLKPANILIRNDGEPALIDFNLSQSKDLVEQTVIGGTLPYMAPEQLRGLLTRQASFSPASDIFSLGVILYEVIEGALPFSPAHSTSESDLLCTLSNLHSTTISLPNREVSGGLKSIVSKCLDVRPERRYGDATELFQDLENERLNLPLRHTHESMTSRGQKLMRRYPRLFSSGVMAAIAAICLSIVASFAYTYWHVANRVSAQAKSRQIHEFGLSVVQNANNFYETSAKSNAIQSLEQLQAKLFAFHGRNPSDLRFLEWLSIAERERLRSDLCSLHLVLAYSIRENMTANSLAPEAKERLDILVNESLQYCRDFFDSSRRHDLIETLASVPVRPAFGTVENFVRLPTENPVDALVSARLALLHNRNAIVARILRPLPQESPYQSLYWLTLGESQLRLRKFDDAQIAFSQATAIAPTMLRAWQRQAETKASIGDLKPAIVDYSRAIELAPFRAELYAERARVYEKSRDYQSTLDDLNHALTLSPESNRLLLFRSRIRKALGQDQLAKDDFDLAIQHHPASESDWVSRALARSKTDPQAGMKDLEQALAINPRSLVALQNKAHIESEYLNDFDASIATLTAILELDPDFELARAGRAVLYGRVLDQQQAVADIDWFEHEDHLRLLASTLYQFGCAYGLLATNDNDYQEKSLKHLTKAVQRGYGLELLKTDSDLDKLRQEKKFEQLEQFAALVLEAEH